MAYFLKKTKLKDRTYLAIYESFYSHDKKDTAHRCYKSLGSIETLTADGMEDPVSHFQAEVDALNASRAAENARKISDKSPILHMGYVPYKWILDKLKIKKYVDLYKLVNNFDYDLYTMLSSLVYARLVNPCSKHRTFHEVLPYLKEECDYSYDQLLDGLDFMGCNYEKFIELFTVQTASVFGIDTKKTYFDCTNFYFEIDREDDFRRKGPSKENRHDPIVGLGLLLDNNLIPIGMKMFPGNESEKPVLRDIVASLKVKNNIKGRTIHVADKGLNCANNIVDAVKNGDGYIFSKSVKSLGSIEKEWVTLDMDFKDVKDSSGKVIYRYKSCIDEFPYVITVNGKKKTVKLKEKRLLTYNPSLASKKSYEIRKMAEKVREFSFANAKRNELGDAAKYISFTGKDGEKARVVINEEAIENDLKFAGYNLIVTSELSMKEKDIYETYHNLWRIEESFRVMKSDLDARPVFLQKQNTIQGHFLICYIAVLLLRILQFKVLQNKFSTSELISFTREFNVTKSESKFINLATESRLIEHLSKSESLPLMNYFLSETQLNTIANHKIKTPAK